MSSAKPGPEKGQQGQSTNDYGAVTEPGTLRLERILPGPIERVWAYLTESEKRGKWLAPGAMELRAGGRVELNWRHADLSAEKTPPANYDNSECADILRGRITRCDPPNALSYTWGDGADASEVTFELSPRAGEVLLVITHRRLGDRKRIVGVASGWHTHVGILIDHLHSREPRPFWTTFVRVEGEYEKRIAAE
jgi:uncharacterized protein YndB with AHSA1/START domain